MVIKKQRKVIALATIGALNMDRANAFAVEKAMDRLKPSIIIIFYK